MSCYTLSGERLTRRIRSVLFKQLSKQEIGYFDDPANSVGKLCTTLSVEASAVQGVTGIRIGTMLSGFSILSVGLVIALIYGWQLALVILAFVPVMIGAGLISMSVISGFSARDKKYLEEAGRIVVESTSNIRTVKQLHAEDYFIDKYSSLIDVVLNKNLKKTIVTGMLFGFSQGIIFFAVAACYYAGADFISRGYFTTEEMMVVFGSLLFGAMSVGQSQAMAPEFGKSIDATKRIYNLLHRVPLIDAESTDGLIPKEFKGIYNFDGVSFNYPSRKGIRVLRNVSISLDSSKFNALVGFSGCGKSTITQLLERFYDPVRGTLFLDNCDVRTLNIQWYRQQLGIVSQEPILFNWSIRDNIAFGDQVNVPNLERIRAAAKSANIDDFIISLPMGYDTIVGSKGSLISGGQKQRICLARALVRNPKMLILDEATSALDSESERVVQAALFAAQKERGSVTIAHKLSTIEGSDHIYVLDNGSVREEGNHRELLDKKGIYYELVNQSQR